MSFVLDGDNRRYVETGLGQYFELVHVDGPEPFEFIMDELAPQREDAVGRATKLPVYDVYEVLVDNGRRIRAKFVLLHFVTWLKAHEILVPPVAP